MGFHFYSSEQRRMDNGEVVTKALNFMNGRGSLTKILKHIPYNQSQTKESVESQLKQVLRRGIESGFLIRRGKTYHFTAQPQQFQIDSDQKRKRSRSRSNSPATPPRRSSSSEVANRRMRTPYRRSGTVSSSSSRLAAINQRMRDEDAEENRRARMKYRQPKSTPKKKKIRFALTPQSAKK